MPGVGQRYDAAGLVQVGRCRPWQAARSTSRHGAAPTVNGAQVLCGHIPTKNATVFVIVQVLTPPAIEVLRS
jgi:hypothetical protein